MLSMDLDLLFMVRFVSWFSVCILHLQHDDIQTTFFIEKIRTKKRKPRIVIFLSLDKILTAAIY